MNNDPRRTDVGLPTVDDLAEIREEADREAAARGIDQMKRGAAVFAGGAVFALITAAVVESGVPRRIVVIAFGAVAVGAAEFVIGYAKWKKGKELNRGAESG